ncbi:MAG: ABC transporter substrate-binding protein [Thermodesulfobacteriota bacterium]
MKTRKSFIILAALVLSICLFLSIPAFSNADSIKLGVYLDLTGASSSTGIKNLKAIEFAAETLNAKGGINGSTIELVKEDTAGDAKAAAALVRKLAADSKIVALIGPVRTSSFVAVAPLVENLKIVSFSPASAGTMDFNNWTFRNTTPAPVMIPPLMRKIKSALNVKTAAVINPIDDDWAKDGGRLFDEACEANGIKIVAHEIYRTKDTDFSAQLTKINNANPAIILISALSNEGSLILSQAAKMGIKAHFAANTNFADNPDDWWRQSGGASVGCLTATAFLIGPDLEPMQKDFVANFRKIFGEDPTTTHVAGYDAILLLADACKRANSTTDRQKIRDALGATDKFKGMGGLYTYKNKGDAERVLTWAAGNVKGGLDVWKP